MHNIMSELKQARESLEVKLNHYFIKDTIPKPLIDEDKLAMVYFLCSEQRCDKSNNYQQMNAIMLMQIALDTHEEIPNQINDSKNTVEKQMTILAGDYYSSLYYFVLAELDEIELIQQIALSTKIINEYKVNLYKEKITSSEQLYMSLGTIESELFTSFANYLGKSYLIPIVSNLLLYNRLLREKHHIVKDEFSYLNYYFEKYESYECKSSILTTLDIKVDECIHEIEAALLLLPYEYNQLKRYIAKKLRLFDKSYIAEEG